ncbi:MAG: hypothetical protein ACI8Y4_000080 [Candidatus Poriferisodalaceae bacterium]
MLMTLGNAGIITSVASLMLGFVGTESDQTVMRSGLLVGGMVLVLVVIQNRRLDRLTNRLIRKALRSSSSSRFSPSQTTGSSAGGSQSCT